MFAIESQSSLIQEIIVINIATMLIFIYLKFQIHTGGTK